MRVASRRIPVVVFVFTALAVAACGGGNPATRLDRDLRSSSADSVAILDPQVVMLDSGEEGYWFDGNGGSLLLGEGWAPTEAWNGESFAWVNGKKASVWFAEAVAGVGKVFRAQCRSLTGDGAAPQLMELRVNGRSVGEAHVGTGWGEVNLEIPGDDVKRGLNEVELSFSWAVRPIDLGLNQDARELAAAFRVIIIADRDNHGKTPTAVRQAAIDPEGGVLELDPRAEIAIPLPPRTGLALTLQTTRSEPDPVPLSLVLDTGKGVTEVWRGDPGSGGGPPLVVENPDARPHSLRLRQATDVEDGAPARGIELVWRPDSVSVERMRGETGSQRPNVFLYLVDTVRADSLALFGGTRPTSPALDRFATDSLVFQDAIAASTWTLPSVVSILTGVYPFRHGIMQGNVVLLPGSRHPTLSEVLGGAGYDTVGISQSYVAGPKFGINTGFGFFHLNNQLNGHTLRSAEVRRSLTQWLTTAHDWTKPVFAYIHTVGPHAPYRPSDEFRTYADSFPGLLAEGEYIPSRFVIQGWGRDPAELAHLRALYDGEVQYADHEFGRFLDALRYFGLYDNSIVIFVSDHGEEFFDHGSFDHGRTVFEEVARVPLAVKLPKDLGVQPGSVNRRVSTLDIFPTVAAVAGVDVSGLVLDGDLLSAGQPAEDGDTGAAGAVFTEVNPVASDIFESVNLRAAWIGTLKCIENLYQTDQFGEAQSRWQVFDLADDPGEHSPLAVDDPRFNACRSVMERWIELRGEGRLEPGAVLPTSPEALEMLRKLGYIK